MTSFGETELAICEGCKEPDTKHEIPYPSKRFEIKNEKKVVACEGFQSFKLPEEPKVELLNEIVLPR